MTKRRGIIWVLAIAVGAWSSAQASETVIGGGFAKECEEAADRAADGRSFDERDIASCNDAISVQTLSRRDVAASYVNRGILYLVKAQYARSLQDFDAAIDMMPELGGAYTNRGAALIAEGQSAAGIAAIDQGLALGAPAPEKSYYNRALGRENLGDLKGAYLDFLQASELKPGWSQPARELARFKVTRRISVSG